MFLSNKQIAIIIGKSEMAASRLSLLIRDAYDIKNRKNIEISELAKYLDLEESKINEILKIKVAR